MSYLIQHSGIVARYVRRHALAAMLGAALLLLMLQVSFAFLGELEDVTEGYSYFQALSYVLWQAPRYLYELLPMAALVGSVIGLGALAANSELTVLRASGTSLFRIVSWVIQAALMLVLCALLLSQYVLPYSNMKAKLIKSPNHMQHLGQVSGYWTRVNDQVVYVDYASEMGDIQGVTVWQLNEDASISTLTTAKTGRYMAPQQSWEMSDVTDVRIADDGSATRVNAASKMLALPVNPALIYLLTRPAEDLSVTQLWRYNQDMAQQGKASPDHKLAFWQKVLSPFSVISLVLIACSFVFGSLRQQSMGLRLVMALMLGLAFRYVQDLAGFMSLAYRLPAVWFVLLPIVASALVGIVLLLRKR